MFRFIVQIVIAESMFEAGHNCLEILDVHIHTTIESIVSYLFGVNKHICYLFLHLRSDCYLDEGLSFVFEYCPALAILEKTKFRHL